MTGSRTCPYPTCHTPADTLPWHKGQIQPASDTIHNPHPTCYSSQVLLLPTMSSSRTMPLRAGSIARRTVVERLLRRHTLVVVIFVVATALHAAPSSVVAAKQQQAAASADASSSEQPTTTCGLYMAISSRADVDGNKWGVYAGHELSKGDNIGTPEVAIHLHNLRANNRFGNPDDENATPTEEQEQQQEQLLKAVEFLEESFWVPDALGGKFEVQTGRIITATPGLGFLGAFDVSLTSADWNVRQNYQRIPIGEVTGDPHENRGAISPFYNVQLWVTADKVVSGSEVRWNSCGAERLASHCGLLLKRVLNHSQTVDRFTLITTTRSLFTTEPTGKKSKFSRNCCRRTLPASTKQSDK